MHEVGIVNGILDTVIRAARGAEEINPQSECLDCGEVFDHDRFPCRCPQCGGANVRLLHGRELDIASIEIETPDD